MDPVTAEGQDTTPVLAGRGVRLVAYLIDTFILLALSVPLALYLDVFSTVEADQHVSIIVQIVFFLYTVLMFIAVNGVLLHKYGQTVGKRLMGIAISDLHGRIPNPWHVIAVRYAALWFIGYLPFIGRLIMFLDPLFIFGKDRRCLHDQLAGTMVVKWPLTIHSSGAPQAAPAD